MTKLAYLHEPGVLYNLESRYKINEIYVRLAPRSVEISMLTFTEDNDLLLKL